MGNKGGKDAKNKSNVNPPTGMDMMPTYTPMTGATHYPASAPNIGCHMHYGMPGFYSNQFTPQSPPQVPGMMYPQLRIPPNNCIYHDVARPMMFGHPSATPSVPSMMITSMPGQISCNDNMCSRTPVMQHRKSMGDNYGY
ncbi:hypothetical protein GJ496_003696 [Pomphorhynchus laevis]|nr:hypothetical protein GJ496_003696 [Pomphorhynchus laevis]